MATGSIPSVYKNVTGAMTPGDGITLSNYSTLVRSGNVVSIYGEASGDFPANTTIASLPDGFRPKTRQFIMCIFPYNNDEKHYRCRVTASGEIQLLYSNTHTTSCVFYGAIVL